MRYALILISLLCALALNAQSIKGQIVDTESKEPIPYATVILNDSEGKFLEGVTTDDDGKYLIKYQKGIYQLAITFMGYETLNADINLNENRVRNFEMNSMATELGEVTVTAERTTVEQLIDKKVINVGQDLLSGGGDAATVLSQLSEVNADEDGNISLRGSSNVTILVNGKPSALSNAELLQQISSNEINTVEIITSPSAKYQASGLTGIVNIITNKKVQKGLSIRTAMSINTLGSYNPSLGVQYGRSKINVKFGGAYNSRISGRSYSQERTGLVPYTQFSDYDFEGNVYSAYGGIDWFLTENDEFSISLNYRDNGHDMVDDAHIEHGSQESEQETHISHSHKTLNTNANYRHYFNEKKGFLEVDAQFSDNSNILTSDFRPNFEVLDNYTNNDVLISNVAADFSNQINNNFKIETGLLWNRQALQNDQDRFEDDGTPLTQGFENTQSTYAAYMMFKYKIENTNIQAGLRGESYKRDANLLTEQTTVSNQFNNFFPSFHLSYEFNKNQSLNLGYNRRTSRPRLSQVNPNPYQGRAFSINKGNPALEPEFSNNIDFSYQYKKGLFRFSPSISYRLKSQAITAFQFVNDEGLTERTYRNNGKSDAWGIELSTSLTFPEWLKSDFSYNWYHEKFRADQIGFARNFSRNSNLTLKNQLTFSKKTSMAITWRYSFDSASFNSDNLVNQNLDIAIRHKILKNKGNINLRVSDLFNTRRWAGTITGDDFTQTFNYKPLSRAVHLSFSYTFKGGKIKKRKTKKRQYGSGVLD